MSERERADIDYQLRQQHARDRRAADVENIREDLQATCDDAIVGADGMTVDEVEDTVAVWAARQRKGK